MRTAPPRPVLLAFGALGALLLAACDADPSIEPGATVTRSAPEPAGEHCELGGIAIHVGVDDDGDGTLDDGEIDTTTFLCEDDLPATLVREDDIPAGDRCTEGGRAVHVGVDDDRDGVLDDAEIDSTTEVCDESDVFTGDFESYMWSDPAQVAALQRARVVTGNLDIAVDGAVALPRLQLVVGRIDVQTGVTELDLPALTKVGGTVYLMGGSLAGDLALPALTRVDGAVSISSETNLDTFAAPALVSIGGSLGVSGNGLDGLGVPALRTIGGGLSVHGEDLEALKLPALETVAGALRLSRNPQLTDMMLPALRSVGGLELGDNEAMETFALPALETIGGDFELESVGLREVALPAVTTLAGGLFHRDQSTLEVLDLRGLTVVDGAVWLTRLPALRELRLDSLVEIKGTVGFNVGLFVSEAALAEVSAPALRRVTGALIVQDSAVTAVRLPALVEVSGLDVYDNANQTVFSAPRVRSLAFVNVIATPLTELRLDALETVTDHLDIRETEMTTFANLGSIRTIQRLDLSRNQRLVDLRGLASLRSLGHLQLRYNPALTSLSGLSGVTDIRGAVMIEYNPMLASLDGLERVARVSMLVIINGNRSLTSVAGLASLASVAESFTLRHNGLTSLAGLENLQVVTGEVDVDEDGVPADEVAAFLARLD